jgi:GT2 family glycosyltransferase
MHQAGWKTCFIPDAYIYHLQGQSIGNNVRSRIEFYRSRYQFLLKWHSRKYYILASAIIISRLLINWVAGLAMAAVTFGLVKKLRQKFAVYSRLILWHFKRDGREKIV